MKLTCRRHEDYPNPNTKAGRIVGQRGFHAVLAINARQPGLAAYLSVQGCNDQNERRLAAQGRHLLAAWQKEHNETEGTARLTSTPIPR